MVALSLGDWLVGTWDNSLIYRIGINALKMGKGKGHVSNHIHHPSLENFPSEIMELAKHLLSCEGQSTPPLHPLPT